MAYFSAFGDDFPLEVVTDVLGIEPTKTYKKGDIGQGIVQMGKSKDNLNFERNVYDDSAILLPVGTWHNLTNTGKICRNRVKAYC